MNKLKKLHRPSRGIKGFSGKYLLLYLLSVCALLFLLSPLTMAIANNGESYPETPEKVVEEFCKEDLKGVRVGMHGGWGNVRKYVSWEDEPGWDGAIIISKYNIRKLQERNDIARVSITYRVLGETDGRSWRPGRGKRMVVFILKRDNGRWRINDPIISPNISLDTAIQILEEATKDISNENTIRALKQLKRIRKSG